jgi:hypothetical protein
MSDHQPRQPPRTEQLAEEQRRQAELADEVQRQRDRVNPPRPDPESDPSAGGTLPKPGPDPHGGAGRQTPMERSPVDGAIDRHRLRDPHPGG